MVQKFSEYTVSAPRQFTEENVLASCRTFTESSLRESGPFAMERFVIQFRGNFS